jgi:hypothetical protein
MLNLVEKYAPETDVEADEGVVAIEYVVTAAALVVALAGLWVTMGSTLASRLEAIAGSI